MRIKQSKNGMRVSFDKPNEGVIFLAKMNESYLSFEAAAKLYRKAARVEDAERCEKHFLKVDRPL